MVQIAVETSHYQFKNIECRDRYYGKDLTMDCHRENNPVVIIGIHVTTKNNRHLPNKTQRNNEKKTKLKEIVEKYRVHSFLGGRL